MIAILHVEEYNVYRGINYVPLKGRNNMCKVNDMKELKCQHGDLNTQDIEQLEVDLLFKKMLYKYKYLELRRKYGYVTRKDEVKFQEYQCDLIQHKIHDLFNMDEEIKGVC